MITANTVTKRPSLARKFWWGKYASDARRLVVGRFDECHEHITAAASAYWAQIRWRNELKAARDSFVESKEGRHRMGTRHDL